MLNILAEFTNRPRWVLEWKNKALFQNAIRCFGQLTTDGALVLERGMDFIDIDLVLQGLSTTVCTCQNPHSVIRIFVIPWTYKASSAILTLSQSHAAPEICNHLVFTNREFHPLLLWYDVDSSPIILRPSLSEEFVAQAAEAAGCTYRFES